MKRFAQFCLVGTSGLFVDMAILYLLSDPSMLAWPVPLGKAAAVEIAMINNFLWNERWTFGDFSSRRTGWLNRLKRFGRFNLICSIGLLISVVVVSVLHGNWGINLYLANLIAIGAGTLWNFGMNFRFNWQLGSRTKPVIE